LEGKSWDGWGGTGESQEGETQKLEGVGAFLGRRRGKKDDNVTRAKNEHGKYIILPNAKKKSFLEVERWHPGIYTKRGLFVCEPGLHESAGGELVVCITALLTKNASPFCTGGGEAGRKNEGKLRKKSVTLEKHCCNFKSV